MQGMTILCGIYGIRGPNDKIYIGQSVSIPQRWRMHKSALRHNRHPCQHLKNAWNKYGEKRFVFFIIEECSYDAFTLLDCEEKHFRFNEGSTYNKPEHARIRSYRNKEPKAPEIKPKKELLSKEELKRRRAEYARKWRANKPPKEIKPRKSNRVLSDEERKSRKLEHQKRWQAANRDYLNAKDRKRYREKGQIRHGKFYGGPIDKDSKG